MAFERFFVVCKPFGNIPFGHKTSIAGEELIHQEMSRGDFTLANNNLSNYFIKQTNYFGFCKVHVYIVRVENRENYATENVNTQDKTYNPVNWME